MATGRVDEGRARRLQVLANRLMESVLNGDGVTSSQARRAASVGEADDPALARYVDMVRTHAFRVTDADVDRLRCAGLSEDAIFELTAAAAVGAASERLEAGLALLAEEP